MLNYLLKGFTCALIMNIFQKNKLDMPVLVKMGFFSSLVLFMIDRMFPEGFKENFDVEEDENTLSILNRYIDESEFDIDKGIIKNIFKDLYRQSCEVE